MLEHCVKSNYWLKVSLKSEETGEFFHCQNKYPKSLSWAENLNFSPKTVSAQDSDVKYLFWQRKKSSVSSNLKQPLIIIKKSKNLST